MNNSLIPIESESQLVEKGKRFFEIMEQIRKIEAITVHSVLELGRLWSIIHDEKLFKLVCSSFRQFCSEECKRSYTTVYNFMALYKLFGQKPLPESIEISRLIEILPIVRKSGNVDEWLEKVNLLPSTELKIEIRKAKGLISSDECQCLEQDRILIERCTKCQRTLSVIRKEKK